ncbi:MAG: hypothetical protein ACR2KZ_20200 [Segetibacter sp.]
MKVSQKTILSLVAAVTMLSAAAFALGNYRDKMKVTFTHPVQVQGDTLAPGKYTIEAMGGKMSENNVLDVYGKNNQKFETSFTTIDAKKMGGADTTHATLLKVDGKYYLNKLFIKGRTYGYQVLLPSNVQSQANTGESEDVAGASK